MITTGRIEGFPIKIHTGEKVLNKKESEELFKKEYLGIWIEDDSENIINIKDVKFQLVSTEFNK